MVLNLLIYFTVCTYPFLIYLFYLICSKNYNTKQVDLVYGLAIWSCLYISIRFDFFALPIMIFNIPIIIAYLKKHLQLSVVISMVVLTTSVVEGYNLVFVLIEYSLYIILYFISKLVKHNENYIILSFMNVKILLLIIQLFSIRPSVIELDTLLYIVFVYYIFTFVILLFYKKANELAILYLTLKDVVKDSFIRDSLFKITHEIKNPLAVCKGYFDMLDINNVEQTRRYVPIIDGEIKRTLTLLADFNDLTKICISKELIDVNLLLEEVVDTMSNFALSKGVALIKNIPDEDFYIDADYNRLKQVMVNMIKNGVEAASLKDSYVKVTSIMKKKYVKIVIEDNGIGMDSETKLNYDKGFYTTKKDGTGLGVSLSKDIVYAHKGDIIYNSEENVGTIVEIMLPKK